MGQLVWTCANGAEFETQNAAVRLVVGHASAGVGFRYRVFGRREDSPDASLLASGSRESLREAIEAAEQAASAIDSSRPG